ncbi:MAG: hypothetical protein HPY64_05095 [Anaerolineae bacterium]|nr:hypothetical protein [Anaerolineae bacterium]
MSSLLIRRAVVAVLSVLAGVLGTWVILLILGTDWAEFGIEALIVVIALGVAAMVWLDYFLSAEILPE